MMKEHERPELQDDGMAVVDQVRPFAVFGNPVEQSLSPQIHAAFARQTGVAMQYTAIPVDRDGFARRLREFGRQGGAGGNVTVPLKADALRLCRELGPSALRSGAVNTLTRLAEGGFRGDNTDGEGFINDLCRRHRHDVRGRRVLLLGAGGAIAGVLPALFDAGADEIVIAARRLDAADALALRIGEPEHVHTVLWSDLADAGVFNLVVNGTSAGHRREALTLPMTVLAPRTIAYDLNYGPAAIDFLAWARAAGADVTMDGLGMLVDQAAVAFSLWHGVEPDADAVYAALRARA